MEPIVVPKLEWQNLMVRVPAGHKVFSHEPCWGCRWPNGSVLHAATIKHVALVIANAARADGTRIYRGVETIAAHSARHRQTVLFAIGHLQAHGLLRCVRLGGGRGARRGKPSEYALTIPDLEFLAVLGQEHVEAARQISAGLADGGEPPVDWFERTR